MKVKRSVLILAVLLGLATMALLYVYIEGKEAPSAAPVVEMGDVVVATTSIPAHVLITEEMVTLKNIPSEAIHPDAATAVDAVVGNTSNVPIYIDEQILTSKVATEENAVNLSYRIPENMRAITIPMNEISGVGGYIMEGDKIDILVTYTLGEVEDDPNTEADEGIEGKTVTYTQFQNLEIIEKGPNSAPVEGQTEIQGVTSSLTLLVTPSQAEVLTYAQLSGSINMTLRNPVDETINELTEFGTDNFNTWRGR